MLTPVRSLRPNMAARHRVALRLAPWPAGHQPTYSATVPGKSRSVARHLFCKLANVRLPGRDVTQPSLITHLAVQDRQGGLLVLLRVASGLPSQQPQRGQLCVRLRRPVRSRRLLRILHAGLTQQGVQRS